MASFLRSGVILSTLNHDEGVVLAQSETTWVSEPFVRCGFNLFTPSAGLLLWNLVCSFQFCCLCFLFTEAESLPSWLWVWSEGPVTPESMVQWGTLLWSWQRLWYLNRADVLISKTHRLLYQSTKCRCRQEIFSYRLGQSKCLCWAYVWIITVFLWHFGCSLYSVTSQMHPTTFDIVRLIHDLWYCYSLWHWGSGLQSVTLLI